MPLPPTPPPPRRPSRPISRTSGRAPPPPRDCGEGEGDGEEGGGASPLATPPWGPSPTLGSFEILRSLGRGSRGEVLEVRRLSDGSRFALKRSLRPLRGPAQRRHWLREARAQRGAGRGPGLLPLLAAWEQRGRFHLLTPLCPAGSLGRLWRRGAPRGGAEARGGGAWFLEGVASSLGGVVSSMMGVASSLGGVVAVWRGGASSQEGVVSSLGGVASLLRGGASSMRGVVTVGRGVASFLRGVVSAMGGVVTAGRGVASFLRGVASAFRGGDAPADPRRPLVSEGGRGVAGPEVGVAGHGDASPLVSRLQVCVAEPSPDAVGLQDVAEPSPATSDPSVATSEPQDVSEPSVATSDPSVATSEPQDVSEPSVATSDSSLATSEPQDVSEPSVATSDPSVATSEPQDVSEPSVATSNSSLATSEPQDVSEPSVATSNSSLATSDSSPATSDPSLATSDPSPATFDPSPATSDPSPATSDPSPAMSDPSPATSEPSPAASEPWAGRPMAEWRLRGYLWDVLLALRHLHARPLAHGDVKPDNVLLDARGRCRLADFGLTAGPAAGEGPWGGGGDPRYAAPEALEGEGRPPGDVFSLGLTVAELAGHRRLPGAGEGWRRLRSGGGGRLPPGLGEGLSPELRAVLAAMLEPDPRRRPSAAELLTWGVLRGAGRWRPLTRLADLALRAADDWMEALAARWASLRGRFWGWFWGGAPWGGPRTPPRPPQADPWVLRGDEDEDEAEGAPERGEGSRSPSPTPDPRRTLTFDEDEEEEDPEPLPHPRNPH